jgi:hypothetical protein
LLHVAGPAEASTRHAMSGRAARATRHAPGGGPGQPADAPEWGQGHPAPAATGGSMKKSILSLAFLAAFSLALAQPFVWPASWTTTPLGEASYGGTVVQGTLSDPRTFHPVLQSETERGHRHDAVRAADLPGTRLGRVHPLRRRELHHQRGRPSSTWCCATGCAGRTASRSRCRTTSPPTCCRPTRRPARTSTTAGSSTTCRSRSRSPARTRCASRFPTVDRSSLFTVAVHFPVPDASSARPTAPAGPTP